jgi:hypothetical protein
VELFQGTAKDTIKTWGGPLRGDPRLLDITPSAYLQQKSVASSQKSAVLFVKQNLLFLIDSRLPLLTWRSRPVAQQCYLCVDLGAESGRVLAGLYDGSSVRTQELHRFRNGPVSVGGTLRWDLVNLWREIQTGIAKGATEFGDSIQSIGVDTWGVDFALLSETEELLGLPYCYRDSRTTGLMEHSFTQVPRAEIF